MDKDRAKTFVFSPWNLVVFGLAFMTPVAPILIYGDLLHRSGGAPSLSYIIAFVVILFTAQSYSKLSRVCSGPAYIYVRSGLSKYAGIFVGLGSLLLYIVAAASAFRVGALFASDIVPETPRFGWILLFTAVSGSVTLLGARATAIANSVFLYLTTAIVAVYVLVCAFAADRGTGVGEIISIVPLNSNADLDAFATGIGLACLSFIGFDSITAVSDASRNPKKNASRAMIVACFLAACLFFLQTYASGLIIPDYTGLPASADAFFSVSNKAGGPPMVYLCTAAIILAAFCVGIAGQTAAYKVLLAIRRNETLFRSIDTPRLLKDRPAARNAIPAIIAILLTFSAAAAIDLPATTFFSVAQFCGCLCFVLVNATVMIRFYFRKKRRRHIVTGLIFPVIGFFSSLYLWVDTEPICFGIMFAATLAAGLIILCPDIVGAIKERRKRIALRNDEDNSESSGTRANEANKGVSMIRPAIIIERIKRMASGALKRKTEDDEYANATYKLKSSAKRVLKGRRNRARK
ncbi:MAG: APC family permease [Clostridiales Family XIII bacterium]|jgi:amino acid transporter|nr:APC family permease [Clostridiales Family XIII bacterium]